MNGESYRLKHVRAHGNQNAKAPAGQVDPDTGNHVATTSRFASLVSSPADTRKAVVTFCGSQSSLRSASLLRRRGS